LSEHLGKQFYVENIGGAGGNVGMGQGAKAAPDGYTIIAVSPNIVVNPTLYDKVPYDPYKDFDPVTIAVATTYVLTVNPSLPVQRILSSLSNPIPANTTSLRQEPGRRHTSSASSSACRWASTLCI
jgi:tripartite-type tricarboxylate transporter receptor subunit TctC